MPQARGTNPPTQERRAGRHRLHAGQACVDPRRAPRGPLGGGSVRRASGIDACRQARRRGHDVGLRLWRDKLVLLAYVFGSSLRRNSVASGRSRRAYGSRRRTPDRPATWSRSAAPAPGTTSARRSPAPARRRVATADRHRLRRFPRRWVASSVVPRPPRRPSKQYAPRHARKPSPGSGAVRHLPGGGRRSTKPRSASVGTRARPSEPTAARPDGRARRSGPARASSVATGGRSSSPSSFALLGVGVLVARTRGSTSRRRCRPYRPRSSTTATATCCPRSTGRSTAR